ncbi:hypothetical protein IU450_13170 [Nocardia abscessus]|uniref:hypothetical protein n=1 Tax=Nocardia abscessus TaxID=120957 RepID=UPI001893BC6E|nr:hypothetical protein [Nocardia abscessus]MBF6336837.1 hypothetical protein [Nocardia abscessus]
MLAEIVVTSRPGRRTIKTGRNQKSLKIVHLELSGVLNITDISATASHALRLDFEQDF